MALDVQSLMLRLNPMRPLDLGDGGQIEQMRLMRERFEEEKRQHREMLEQRSREEAGAMARERMRGEQERVQREEAKAAELLKNKQTAYQEFTKRGAAGDIEGAHAMVPYMESLGMGVELEGEQDGLPRYRIAMDKAAEQAEQQRLGQSQAQLGNNETAEQSLERLQTMGLGEETGTLDDPAAARVPDASAEQVPLEVERAELDPAVSDATDLVGSAVPGLASLSSQDPYLRARAAAADSEAAGGEPTRRDQPDTTGGVPRNVIDFGAIHDQTMQRLNPALAGFVASYPEEYRGSAEQTAQAVRSLGVPAVKGMEMAKDMRSSPDDLIKAQLEAQAAGVKDETPDFMQRNQLEEQGRNAVKETADTYKLKDLVNNRAQYAIARERLLNKDNTDDAMVGALISRRMGERGATTEPDIQRVFGTATMSFLEKIEKKLYDVAIGGLTYKQKNALIKVLKEWEDADRKQLHEIIGQVEDEAGQTQPDKARGMRSQLRLLVPKATREEWETSRKKPEGEASTGGGGSFDADAKAALEEQSKAAGLDPAKVLNLIQIESGGNPAAQNPSGATGLLQFMPSIAKNLGTTTEEIKKMSAKEQVPLVLKYLTSNGVTGQHDQGDYYVAVAAPAFLGRPDDTKVYEKGTPEYDQNKVWDVDGDGVITVGNLKAFGGGKRGGAKEPPPEAAKPAEPFKLTPKTDADKKLLEKLGL